MNLKQKLSKKQSKITEHFTQSKIYIKTFCIYKIYLISAKGYENAGVDFLRVKRNGEVWTKMRNVQDGLRVQNIYDLVLIEIYGIYKTKNLTKEKIKKYKMTERKIIEKYDDLSENELNAKNNKEVCTKIDFMTTVMKFCRGENVNVNDSRLTSKWSQVKNRKHIYQWFNVWKIHWQCKSKKTNHDDESQN